jgi:hypothetical protein
LDLGGPNILVFEYSEARYAQRRRVTAAQTITTLPRA